MREENANLDKEYYKEFVEETDALVTQVDAKGNFIYVNESIEKVLGYSANDSIGTSAFNIVFSDDIRKNKKNFIDWVKNKINRVTYENRLITKDGKVLDFLWTITLHYTDTGKFKYINSFGRDISYLKETERKLKYISDFKELILNISPRFTNVHLHEIDAIINFALKSISEFMNIDIAYICMFSDDYNALSTKYLWSNDKIPINIKDIQEFDSKAENKWIYNLIQKTSVSKKLPNDLLKIINTRQKKISHSSFVSSIEIPLVFKKTIFGFLGFSSLNENRIWDDEEKSILYQGSLPLTVGIQRKKIEFQFNKTEKLYSSIYKSMNEALILFEIIYNENAEILDLVTVDVNPRFEIVTGLKSSDIVGLKTSEHFGFVPFKEKCSQIDNTGESTTFETFFEPLNKHLKISAFSMGKGKLGTIISDITKEKNTFQELKQLKNQLESDNYYLKKEIKLQHNFEEIITDSKLFIKVLKQVEQIAERSTNVLILGETGTGKELISRAIHSLSLRNNRAMVKLNCATIPENLIESELFGHEKGAFTGAIAKKPGRFELADGSTLFLDEIGELPLHLQPKLLRVLQEGEFERLGGTKTLKVNVRIIAASNKNLEKEVEKAHFRQDLFYRLNVFPIHLPPLRERKEDIPLLTDYFVKKFSADLKKNINSVPKKIIDTFLNYDWPGNIRELENIIERSVIITNGTKLEIGDWFKQSITKRKQSKYSSLEEIEKEYILEVLENCNWKVSGKNGAAEILKIKPTTLEARLKKLGIIRKFSS